MDLAQERAPKKKKAKSTRLKEMKRDDDRFLSHVGGSDLLITHLGWPGTLLVRWLSSSSPDFFDCLLCVAGGGRLELFPCGSIFTVYSWEG